MISFAPVLPPDTRLFTVVGHFGSGKTEFAVNLALQLRTEREQVALADLDVVDPYFRSRECEPLLAEKGIRLISSANTCRDADLPSMPAEVNVLLDNPGLTGVLDIGGDPSGARVLARYRRRMGETGAALLCVVNANRPLSDTPDKCIDYIRRIEDACGMAVTALVSNTHCCHLTEVSDVLAGAEMAREVSEKTGIPVLCHCAPQKIAAEVPLPHVFPLELFMKKPWE